ncbi:hypothetical protein MA20_05105 [Bradyrhizobium japonicum]|uniref:Uncharacterized protein n=1 Tax=Bradyrhizobium japonicum TaxID=375 RepID=A0A0A3Y5G0_BRAJP|nr:hypothetical protein [Bradyrhizobium japonicum]KGT80804.1 hypothetical protein MA20_05105 [Bradyrhizobium japonicum]
MATLLSKRELHDDLAFVEKQLSQYSDPYDTVRFMWEQRRADLVHRLEEAGKTDDSHAEVALLFEGGPVVGSQEIRLQFATQVLDSYQTLVAIFAAEKGGAELKARGKLPKAFTSKLFIRDMLRGSVGFLLEEPPPPQASMLPTVLRDAVHEATASLRDLSAASSDEFQLRVEAMSPRAMGAVKRLSKTLAEAGAAAKIVDDEEELSLTPERVATLQSRLNDVEVVETTEELDGVLLGIFPDRQQYEFQVGPLENGLVIYGSVSEDLDERYIANPAEVLLKPARARFQVITTFRAGQKQSEERVLQTIVVKTD